MSSSSVGKGVAVGSAGTSNEKNCYVVLAVADSTAKFSTPRKGTRFSIRSDRSDASASSVMSELKVETPTKMDVEARPAISREMHTKWIAAIASYKPRVEVTDPEAMEHVDRPAACRCL